MKFKTKIIDYTYRTYKRKLRTGLFYHSKQFNNTSHCVENNKDSMTNSVNNNENSTHILESLPTDHIKIIPSFISKISTFISKQKQINITVVIHGPLLETYINFSDTTQHTISRKI